MHFIFNPFSCPCIEISRSCLYKRNISVVIWISTNLFWYYFSFNRRKGNSNRQFFKAMEIMKEKKNIKVYSVQNTEKKKVKSWTTRKKQELTYTLKKIMRRKRKCLFKNARRSIWNINYKRQFTFIILHYKKVKNTKLEIFFE